MIVSTPPRRKLRWIACDDVSHDSNDSRTTEISLPSLEESDFEDTPISTRRPSPKVASRKFVVTPRGLLLSGMLLFATHLLVGFGLRKAGVTERDLIEDFLAQSVLPNLENGWARINGSISAAYLTQEGQRPGFQLAQQGAKAHYPVVMIPGFVTSGLELWGGEVCARKHFRQRLWGSLGTARTFFTDRDCFLRHLSLDPFTGGDPENIRLRASEGFEAADYFMSTYWVWGKLIENLADLGYDGSSMTMMSYDWRLAFPVLEERDGYLTKLKVNIEAMHKTSGKKVVLTSHSLGTLLALYFFAWVTKSEKDGGGGGGKNWVDEHVHAFVNLAGPILGVPKAAPALLSGEMKDTSVLLGTIGTMVEQFFGRRLRKELWITFGSLWTMLPKGGDAIWGSGFDLCNDTATIGKGLRCQISDPVSNQNTGDFDPVPFLEMTDVEVRDDILENNETMGETFCHDADFDNIEEKSSTVHKTVGDYSSRGSLSTEETIAFLREWGGGYGPSLSGPTLHDSNGKSSMKTWHDPSVTPLPRAPSMKLYCLYGVGLKTERAYFYKRSSNEDLSNDNASDNTSQCRNTEIDLPFLMDTSIDNEAEDIRRGVKFADGDGSVPLLSLGHMCVNGWKQKKYNPSGIEVITREYLHKQAFLVEDPMRGGPKSADHVDIMGNVDMTADFLRIATDFEVADVDDQIVSDIENISRRIESHQKLKKSRASLFNRFVN